jgi:hypothetical protein
MHTLYRLAFASGKFYIGQTIKPLRTRMVAHRQAVRADSQLPVHCAWRVHGEPVIEVIGTFATHEELHAAEVDAIKTMNTRCPNGYNITIGGDTAPSKNPEVAAKIAAKARGRKCKDPQRFVEVTKKLWQDPEYRAKVSAGMKAAWTPEMREAAAQRNRDRAGTYKHSEETKAKISARVVTDETRARMSESARGKVLSAATKAKIGEASKQRGDRRNMTPELKASLSAGIKAAWADPIKRERLMAARQAAWATRRAKLSPLGVQAVATQLAPAVDSVGALS